MARTSFAQVRRFAGVRQVRRFAGARQFRWARRGVLAATLLAVALVPYPVIGSASVPSAPACRTNCPAAGSGGTILWSRPLAGAWTASSGLTGTVPVRGQAYAAVGHGVAVVGVGMSLRAYNSRTGQVRWHEQLPGFPAGSAIVSVRAWPGVVTVGVDYGSTSRAEVVLSSATGQQYHWYSATRFGGAVAASTQTTVVVGPGAVTAYDNATGRVRWSRSTGSAAQAWQVNGSDLYVTVAADGYLGTDPVTALRRIDLSNGLESIVRPSASSFPGTLSGVVDNVVLFASATAVTAYDGLTGLRLWSLSGAVLESSDPAEGRFYLTQGTSLLEVDPGTGHVLASAPGSAVAGSAGLFAVQDGVALGLDQGANGEAWGYDVSTQQVTWTTSSLPWPHYFVDLSGIGGSADADGTTVVIASCGKLGPAPASSATPSVSGSTVSGSTASGSAASGSTASGSTASGSAGSGSPSADPSASPGSSSSGSASGTPAASGSAQSTPAASTPAPTGQLCQAPELVAITR